MAYKLPIPPRPLPGEALASLMVRASRAYGLENPSYLFARVDLGPVRPDFAEILRLAPESEPGKAVQHVLGLTMEEADWMTTRCVERGRVRIMGLEVEMVQVRLAYRRFCPLCLADGIPYHHAVWDLLPLTACPTHAVLLQDECPECARQIRWVGKPLEICHRTDCAADLRAARAVPVAETVMGGIRELFARVSAPAELPLPIEGLTFGDWLTLSLGVGLLAAGRRPGRSLPGSLEPLQGPVVLDSGCRILRNWPTAFHDLLDEVRASCVHSSPAQPVRNGIPDALTNWIRKRAGPRCWPILAEALLSYVGKHPEVQILRGEIGRYLRNSGARRPNMPAIEAMRMLNLTFPQFKKVAANCGLYFPPARRGGRLSSVRIDLVRELETRAARELTDRETCKILNISKCIYESLCRIGVIPEIPERQRVHLLAIHDRSDVLAFMNRLQERIMPSPSARLVNLCNRYGQLTAAWCQAILAGSLVPRGIDETAIGLRRILVDRKEALAVSTQPRADYTTADAAKRLGLHPGSLRHMVRRGLVIPASRVGKKLVRISAEEVKRLRSTYIFGREMAERLFGQENRRTALHLMHAGVVPVCWPAVDGCGEYVFRRSDLIGIDASVIDPKRHAGSHKARRSRAAIYAEMTAIGTAAMQILQWDEATKHVNAWHRRGAPGFLSALSGVRHGLYGAYLFHVSNARLERLRSIDCSYLALLLTDQQFFLLVPGDEILALFEGKSAPANEKAQRYFGISYDERGRLARFSNHAYDSITLAHILEPVVRSQR